MVKLLVYGDSFAGPPTRYDVNAYSWVDLLADNLKIPYINRAVAGSSLQYTISVFIKNHLENKIDDNDVLVFALTEPSRLHLARQHASPRTATRYAMDNHFENKKDFWYQINKNYLKWYLHNKDAELDYINASGYLHMLQSYARSKPNSKIIILNSYPNNYYIPLSDNVPNFMIANINLKTASDNEFNKSFDYKDWESYINTDIRSNHFSIPNLKILANSITDALVFKNVNKINYDNFLKEILDYPIKNKNDYKRYIDKGYLFYSENIMKRLK